MGAGAFLEGDFMSFKLRDALDRAIFRHQNHFGFRFGRLDAHVNQIGPGGLGKNWRNITGAAEIDTADVERFQHLRPSREFNPRDFSLRIAFLE